MEIVTRSQARERGITKFFTGKPCKHGHLAIRWLPSGTCSKCSKLAADKWYIRRKKHKLDQSKRNYRLNRENVIARTCANQKNNRKRYAEYVRNWRKKNPDKAHQSCMKWRRAHPETVAKFQRSARGKRTNCVGSHTEIDIQNRMKWQFGKCAACRISILERFHVDHYQPLVRGGSNYPSNIQLLCPKCNLRKHAKDPIDFYQSLGFLL